MNTTIERQLNGSIKPSELTDWLVSHGIVSVTTEECAHLLGVPVNEVPQRLVRLRYKKQLVELARGLYVAVPAEYREMEAPEPMHYIDHLMSYYQSAYCVGWLSAAAIHGARHQAAQVFQVATAKHYRNRTIGRSSLQFYTRRYVSSITTTRVNQLSGSAIVATPGATMLMAAADLIICGGIDNVATIIAELAEENPDYLSDVVSNAELFSTSAVRRLGWILENVAEESGLDELSVFCRNGAEPSVLSPYNKRSGAIDTRWNLIINRRIEAETERSIICDGCE